MRQATTTKTIQTKSRCLFPSDTSLLLFHDVCVCLCLCFFFFSMEAKKKKQPYYQRKRVYTVKARRTHVVTRDDSHSDIKSRCTSQSSSSASALRTEVLNAVRSMVAGDTRYRTPSASSGDNGRG
jgi:hypothetical protein